MQEGDRVTLQGLESASSVHLNGRKGTISGRKGDRFIVFLDTGEVSVLKKTTSVIGSDNGTNSASRSANNFWSEIRTIQEITKKEVLHRDMIIIDMARKRGPRR